MEAAKNMKDKKSKLKEATTKIITKQVENVSVKNNSWLKHKQAQSADRCVGVESFP